MIPMILCAGCAKPLNLLSLAGEAATPDMVEAHGRIVRLAMNGREYGRETC